MKISVIRKCKREPWKWPRGLANKCRLLNLTRKLEMANAPRDFVVIDTPTFTVAERMTEIMEKAIYAGKLNKAIGSDVVHVEMQQVAAEDIANLWTAQFAAIGVTVIFPDE